MLTLLLWAIAVSLCFFGWGAIALKIMRFPRMPLAMTGAFGAAIAVMIGGLLNLEGLLRIPMLRMFVAAGVVLFLCDLPSRKNELLSAAGNGMVMITGKPLLGGIAIVVCLLATSLAMTAVKRKVFFRDDTQAYLAFTIKTPQLGSIPADPFSDRRIKSSLGSNYFLKALMLPDGDFRSTGFPDSGFGYLLFFALAYHLGRELLTRRRYALAVAGVAAALPFVRVNEQMYMLPASLFLACFLFMLRTTGWRLGLLLGITTAAAATMKSSFTPFAMSMPGLFYLLSAQKSGWRRVSGSLVTATTSFVAVILPWMADSKTKNGTWFYPILGDGFHVTAYLAQFPELRINNASLLTLVSFAPLSGALAALSLIVLVDRESTRSKEIPSLSAMAFGVAAALSTAVVGYATAGESVGRYSLPFIYPATLVIFVFLFQRWQRQDRKTIITTSGLGLAAVWVVFLMAYYGAILEWGDYREYPTELKSLFSDDLTPVKRELFTDAELRRIFDKTRAWQSTVPAGEPIFAATIRSEGVDFSRNQLYVADTPGMASLPPGMPFKDPERLRAYFRAKNIRYVVFSEDSDDEAELKKTLAYKGRRVVINREAMASCEARITLRKLRPQSRVVYDDGELCVMQVY